MIDTTQTRHTPGPWFVVPYGDGDSLVIHSSENNRVCFMSTPSCRDRDARRKSWRQIKANARLIAAAPELLESLGNMIRIVEDHVSMGALGVVEGPDGQPGYPLLAEYLHNARAAISKAIGQ